MAERIPDPPTTLAKFLDEAVGIASIVFPTSAGFRTVFYDVDSGETIVAQNDTRLDKALCFARSVVPEGRQVLGEPVSATACALPSRPATLSAPIPMGSKAPRRRRS